MWPPYRRAMQPPPLLAASLAAIGQVAEGFARSLRAGTRPWPRMAHAGASARAVDALEMGEQHLDFLPSAAGRFIFWRPNERPSYVAGIFVYIARNSARRHIGAAPRLEIADVAILLLAP